MIKKQKQWQEADIKALRRNDRRNNRTLQACTSNQLLETVGVLPFI